MTNNRIKLVSSNLEAWPRDALRWGASDWQAFAGENGQLMWSDLRGTRRVAKKLARLGVLHELHQSWRQATTLSAMRSFEELSYALGMPSVEGSLSSLARIQRHASEKLPIVVLPNEQDLGDHHSWRTIDYQRLAQAGTFKAIRYQLTAELAANLGLPLDDPEVLVTGLAPIQARKGFDEKTIADCNLMIMERGKHQFADPVAIIGQLAARQQLAEIHFGVQPEFGGNLEHLEAMLNGDIAKTPHGKMLAAALAETPQDQSLVVVSETPAYGFERLRIPYIDGHHQLHEQITAFASRAA